MDFDPGMIDGFIVDEMLKGKSFGQAVRNAHAWGEEAELEETAKKVLQFASAIESLLARLRNEHLTELNKVEKAIDHAIIGIERLKKIPDVNRALEPGPIPDSVQVKKPKAADRAALGFTAPDPLLAPPCVGTAKIGDENFTGIFGSSAGGGWRTFEDRAGNISRVRTRGPVKCTAGAAEPQVDMGGYKRSGPAPKDARKTTASFVGNGPPPCQGSGLVGGKKVTGIFGERKGGGWRKYREDMSSDPVKIQTKGPVRCEAKLPDNVF